MSTDNKEAASGELLPAPATINARRARCSLDDAYIFNFTNNPKSGKSAALRAAGFDGEYLRQEAYRMHARLRPRIREVLREITRDLGNLSQQQLEGILKQDPDSVGMSNMLAAIKLGMEYSGNRVEPADALPDNPAPADLDKHIENLTKQIEDMTG